MFVSARLEVPWTSRLDADSEFADVPRIIMQK